MKPESVIKKAKQRTKKKYRPTEFDRLQRDLRNRTIDANKLSDESIDQILTMITGLLAHEKKGLVHGVEIRFLKEVLSITWDDKSLGSPILIKLPDKQQADFMKEKYYMIKEEIRNILSP